MSLEAVPIVLTSQGMAEVGSVIVVERVTRKVSHTPKFLSPRHVVPVETCAEMDGNMEGPIELLHCG